MCVELSESAAAAAADVDDKMTDSSQPVADDSTISQLPAADDDTQTSQYLLSQHYTSLSTERWARS